MERHRGSNPCRYTKIGLAVVWHVERKPALGVSKVRDFAHV